MQSHLSEEALWANSVAARLRLLQASFADDDPHQRQAFLAEQLDQSLQQVSPSRRDVHLRALEELFPTWSAPVAQAGPKATAPLALEQLMEQLGTATAALSETEKAGVADKLRKAGLPIEASQPPASAALPELSKVFGIADGAPLNADRTQKMVLGLSALFLALDQLVWTLWRQLNARSIYRKDAEFGKLAGPYLTGDTEVSSEQIRQTLERTRRLIAALLGAMGRSGANFARRHSADLAPESIENAARIEKKAFESLEAASWRRYRELYKEYSTEQTLEGQIQQEFVKSAEELLRGIGR